MMIIFVRAFVCVAYIIISAVKFLIILRREKEPQICGSLLF